MSDTRTVTREALAAALRTLGSVYEANRSNANGMADAIFAALPAPGLDVVALLLQIAERAAKEHSLTIYALAKDGLARLRGGERG